MASKNWMLVLLVMYLMILVCGIMLNFFFGNPLIFAAMTAMMGLSLFSVYQQSKEKLGAMTGT